ncbi:MAG: hypothetical protein WDM85_13435 [Caulobacteraceae bacterium]
MAMIELVGLFNSPQRDDLLLREAGVALDRALFPLLVRLGMSGAAERGGPGRPGPAATTPPSAASSPSSRAWG